MFVGNFQLLARRTDIFREGSVENNIQIKGSATGLNSLAISGVADEDETITIGDTQTNINLGNLSIVSADDYLIFSRVINGTVRKFRFKWPEIVV
jgi:hypothetical protein